MSCWGDGFQGQLGNGGTFDKTTPTLTSSLGTGRTAVALSSGGAHTCAILDNGDVSCWGEGSDGQLGNGATSDKTTPTLTSSLGTGRTALLIDGDKDGDGVYEHLDSYPGDSIRSIKCNTGQFGRYQCVDAPLGKFVPSSGSMYATDASPGYFVSSAGQSSATACSPGYYQASSGQTSCDAADAGYYVSGTAQTSQTACAAGTFSSTTGSVHQPRVLTLQQDILCHLLVSRVQPHAVLDTIKHPPVKHPVMLLMQATMFLAQPKRARLLVLLERLVVRQVQSSCD